MGKSVIRDIRRRWVRNSLTGALMAGLSAGVVAYCACLRWQFSGWWVVAAFIIIFTVAILNSRYWQVKDDTVVRYLDQTFPSLEDSTGLLLHPPANLLETLQQEKISAAIHQLQYPRTFYKSLWSGGMWMGIALIISLLLLYWPVQQQQTGNRKDIDTTTSTPPPGISRVKVRITPPAYTRRPAREQQQLHITAEDSSLLQWELHTTGAVQPPVLLLNDSIRLPLQQGKDPHTFILQYTLRRSGFYQLLINNKPSEYYQLQMTPDLPPVIRIVSPAPYTVIEYGQAPRVNIKAHFTDDYGISDALIAATIASGSGEAVRFREQQLTFDQAFHRQMTADATKTLQLGKLGMQPGDELYFHIAVTDTRHQQTRSDVMIISLPDTAQLLSLEGLANSVNFKPEYFRSQRQIIIDAEQLLREKDTLPLNVFKNRSNNLGIDQKLLRLRYGKFLGEEAETNIGDPRAAEAAEHDHDHDHDHGHEEAETHEFGNAEKIMDQYAHKHDNAEDATFLEPAIKAQLKATLTEMWNAELRLRVYKPQEALPYAYKALRLLKDLQQQSRVYVAKTGVKTTPLKPEKRLTGELDKIMPATRRQQVTGDDENLPARTALALLSQLKDTVPPAAREAFAAAARLLATHAASSPARYLPALDALRRIQMQLDAKKRIAIPDIQAAASGLQHLLASPRPLPAARKALPDNSLQQLYFIHLQQKRVP